MAGQAAGTGTGDAGKAEGAGSAAAGDAKPPEGTETEASETLSYDEWLQSQETPIQQLIQSHTQGLRSALDGERATRKNLEVQLKKLSRAEEDPAKKAELDSMRGQLGELEKQVAFYEAAVKPEVAIASPGLAYLAAKNYGLIDDKGVVNWGGLKAQFPELFIKKQAPPPGNAGTGTNQGGPRTKSMNELLREAAGHT